MKTRLLRILLLVTALCAGVDVVQAFYDPGAQRWINRDPLGDIGSLAYKIQRTEPRTERLSQSLVAQAIQNLNAPLADFMQINGNLARFVANNPLGYIDPRGLDWLDCMANCVQAKDPLNNLGKAGLTGAGGTFPKSWCPAGGGVGGGGSPVTTLPSRLSLGAGGGNAARVVGRIFSPIWIGYGLYLAGVEAACAGTCTGDPTAY